ncbi:uncharacterized protein LOC111462748 [Cucurbita moschata]|uniref:Uncharacterized protein LOC111462748 n=1 Tax=Cucurbita moschata TaxID=3662 RepID=A0A6J1HE90_CUCMO|nr:uncharacterized protein LOC111462748 [Cucurbita moschata]
MKKNTNPIAIATSTKRSKMRSCTNSLCFFCLMKETHVPTRRAGMKQCLSELPYSDDHDHVLVLSALWHIAMAQPNDKEYPSLGVFECMGSLIQRGLKDKDWVLRDQNIYIPYYAAHVIGSYTMHKAEFAEKAVESGVIPPLMELLRGKMSWVEQRVSVRALGHLASYNSTFEALIEYQEEIVKSAMEIASSCLDLVYEKFVGSSEENREKYHRDLLTRGVGGREIEDRKAEEWASQLQCWCLHLVKCFASKGMCLNLICNNNPIFLRDLCGMWGGLSNYTSTGGVGLIRILSYNKFSRKFIAESTQIIETLCNLCRSSDDWQYIGIECLLLLLKDPQTRYKVIEIAAFYLVDLVEIRRLGDRTNINLGEAITQALLSDYNQMETQFLKNNQNLQRVLREVWVLKVERKRKEKLLCEERLEEKRALVNLIKQAANELFRLGEIEAAMRKYKEALDLCPLKFRKERMVLHSNKSQCHLLLRDPDAAISDSTRALCYSNPTNSHGKSLWRRSQAYDMKGLAKESLMDCIMFVNGGMKMEAGNGTGESKRIKIPYHAARMISKQMEAAWLFAPARLKKLASSQEKKAEDSSNNSREGHGITIRTMTI